MAAGGPRSDDWFDVRLTALDLQLQEIDSAVRQHRDSESRLRALEHEVRRFLDEGRQLLADAQRTLAAEQARRANEWPVAESRLFETAARRLDRVERRIAQEWQAIRQAQEASARALEQRARAAEDVVARAAGRLEGLDAAAGSGLAAAAREVRDALADLRQTGSAPEARAVAPAPWPADAESRAPAPPWLQGALVGGLIALVAYVVVLHLRVDAALERAEQRASSVEQQSVAALQAAQRSAEATRDAAARSGAEALATASRAERVATLLAAADLRRATLLGQQLAPAAAGQALWSRSAHLVALSAAPLAPAPAAQVYQAWMHTARGPVSLGLLAPDAQGRLSASYDLPPELTGVQGFSVTLERAGGGAAPSSDVVLASAF